VVIESLASLLYFYISVEIQLFFFGVAFTILFLNVISSKQTGAKTFVFFFFFL